MRWFVVRVAQAAVTAAIAIAVLFLVVRAVPGDPLASLDDDRALTAEQVAVLRERYGLDQPLPRQFAAFASGLLRGDLGTSFQYGRPVTQLLAERLPATLLLGTATLLVTFGLGLWLGVVQARHRGDRIDHALTVVSLAGHAMPGFWLGLMLALLFGVTLRWLPAAGMADPALVDASLVRRTTDVLRHLVLPVATLALVSVAAVMRYQRTAMIEALAQPFVHAARARGLGEGRVVWRHAWRNALFPVLTLLGLWLPIVVVGSVFVEQVFAWPGLGSLAASAASARDYPLLMGTAVVATVAVVLGGLLTDVAHLALDPRLRRR
ncbi:MAG: ABC transporter permease [Gemmatimonadales bacterium]|nr:ABC transporter permease [Gemmatimonadales bacterium]